ncbi:MucB/RseB C-terminal domain-containing protein [Burkholderiaceae bacterium DAT-1]|nr:MucB/RseB C-terminal domain-containing protein [Burkholderiaceae bacterium DAT-1]
MHVLSGSRRGGSRWGRAGMGALALAMMASVLAADLLTASEAADVLKRASAAARNKTYTGIYNFIGPGTAMSFRLYHLGDALAEQERREALDGVPVEYVRTGDTVLLYAEGRRPMHIDKQTSSRFFPAIAPDQIADVLENYVLRRIAVERVAGMECMSFSLEPKDKLRNPHRMCVDQHSGLVLKFVRFAPGWSEIIDQQAFLQIDLSGGFDRRLLASVLASKSPERQVAAAVPAPPAQTAGEGPVMGELPKGFRLMQSSVTMIQEGNRVRKARQYTFSDGMALVSVFVERDSGTPVSQPAVKGTSFYTRQLNGWRVVAVGEVPPQTVQLFAEAFALK